MVVRAYAVDPPDDLSGWRFPEPDWLEQRQVNALLLPLGQWGCRNCREVRPRHHYRCSTCGEVLGWVNTGRIHLHDRHVRTCVYCGLPLPGRRTMTCSRPECLVLRPSFQTDARGDEPAAWEQAVAGRNVGIGGSWCPACQRNWPEHCFACPRCRRLLASTPAGYHRPRAGKHRTCVLCGAILPHGHYRYCEACPSPSLRARWDRWAEVRRQRRLEAASV